jgi:two-component system, OmpR family, phosphate regulon sensor histidine kinase PhoR
MGSVTVFHDVTSLKQLDEMKSGFVNMVSHELRSPLGTIVQQLSVILEGLAGDLTEKQRAILGRSSEKLRSLLNLINDLLDIARIEGGRGIQQQTPLNIGDVLTQTVEFLRPKAENQRLELTLDLPSRLPSVLADPRSMEELFTNLISNAINYSPDGGSVRVFAAARGGCLEVSVSDSGVGIAPEEIPKIFDKFYRVKHPRTRQVIGTGLGLAIVRGIVESHRGVVEVESEPGVGSTFRVLLPVIG